MYASSEILTQALCMIGYLFTNVPRAEVGNKEKELLRMSEAVSITEL